MNLFSVPWSPCQFFSICIHSWSRGCGCSTGNSYHGKVQILLLALSFSYLPQIPPNLCSGKESEKLVLLHPGNASMLSTLKGQPAWHTQRS